MDTVTKITQTPQKLCVDNGVLGCIFTHTVILQQAVYPIRRHGTRITDDDVRQPAQCHDKNCFQTALFSENKILCFMQSAGEAGALFPVCDKRNSVTDSFS